MKHGPVLLSGTILFVELGYQKKSTQREDSTCLLFHLPVSNNGVGVSNGAKKTTDINATHDFHPINFFTMQYFEFSTAID